MRGYPRLAIALAIGLAALPACGEAERAARSLAGEEARKLAADEKVIRAWAQALRAGDVQAAAAYFAIPSVAENGPPAIRLESREDAELFNISLTCGARVLRVRRAGRYVRATFRLTGRPGGACGDGVGGTARTNFRIRAGRIVEWRRVRDPESEALGEPA